MSIEQTSYRKIFKATSLFGGVQIYAIIISVIKSKFIAILLGPTGMGISGLFTATTSLIQSITSMGLANSAVKNVAEAHGSGDIQRINFVVTVLRRLVWYTGFLGFVVTLILSPLLSKSAFGNYDYTIPFAFLSFTLLLQQLSAGQGVVLQGLRRLKDLAKAGVIGSTLGLVISIPLYFFFGVNGIVPTLILNSITTLLLTWWFSKKVKINEVELSFKQTTRAGREMLKMGIALSYNSILVLGVSFVLKLFLGNSGGVEQVGLYMAGFTIVNTYVGLIFTAMTKDYYPRLAEVNNDNIKCASLVNQQSEIAYLILTPLLLIFLIFIPFVIRILYSKDFMIIEGFMQWSIVGMLLKTSSWAIAYQFIAKSEAKLFIVNETIANIYSLLSSVIGYKLFGLTGLGIAFSFSFLIYLIQVFIITRKRYNYKFSKNYTYIFIVENLLLGSCFLSLLFFSSIMSYIISILIFIISLLYSYKELNKLIDINSFVKIIFKR